MSSVWILVLSKRKRKEQKMLIEYEKMMYFMSKSNSDCVYTFLERWYSVK